MKRNVLTALLLSVCLMAAGQSFDTSHSYVSERIYLNEEGTKYIDNVTYLDGFGRKLQEVQVKGSPDGTSDLVQPYSYGKMGRTERTFLPYAKANNNGAFVANPLNAAHWNAYGTADAAYAYTQTEYDNSPLNRVIRQTGPGSAWHTAGKAITTSHDMNDTNEVRLYRVNKTSGLPYQDGHYRRGSLEKVTATDEDGHTTETFTDNQGKTILTVVVNGEERLETYYVYDNRELLRWVLSPEATHRVGLSSTMDTEALYKYAYYYEYDWLKRMTFKKLPGCEPVYMVYDKRDRLVLTQDGNMRAANANKWSYTEYNTKNRPVESGEIVLSSIATHAQLIESMMDSESVPSGTRTPLQYIRYDKYTANEHVTPHAFTPVSGYAEDYHRKTIGRVTATKTRVLGTDQWITSTIYYDSKCRPMQEITDNLVGGVTRVTHSYDFVGNVVKSQEAHGINTLEYAYTYDDRSRLLNVTASFNGATPVTMKTLEYDEVGRLKKVNLHNNMTSSEYDYNIRNWLTEITGSKFSQSLSYGNGNGNIRSMNWSADGSNHSYAFTYDGANRMLNATHGTGAYTEKVTSYDKNGNILGLQRYGNGLIDNLAYSYNGNQLTRVDDATNNPAGFNNGASTANEYTYDHNGNLTKDSNKNISSIAYNVLNLPSKVTFSDGSIIVYSYSADGTKLRTVHTISGTTTTKDYCGDVIYENGIQKLLLTEEGYVDLSDGKYYYCLKDHQGNNRVVIKEDGTVQETNHYYPFGGVFASTGNVQPYKYNGKELDTKKGLNWYDYGARHYDASLGRWFVVDPLSEKYYSASAYSYCLNNPVKYVDPDGMRVWILFHASSDLRFKAAAETRKKEIESMKGFNFEKDKVYIQNLGNLGSLEDRVSSIVNDASKHGYGNTTEVAFWSHGGADGPIGEGITSGEYNLMNYTGSILDQNQLSLAGWERINWNFDSDNSLIAFYGCQTAGFAERLLEVLKDVTHTAGQGAQVGPSYSTGKFESVSFWYSLFPTTKSVYYGSSVNGNFEGVTLFEKGKLDNSNILKGNASLR